MILSPIEIDSLDEILNRFREALQDDGLALIALERIAASRGCVQGDILVQPAWHEQAVNLAAALGMDPLAEAPQQFLSWDGRRVRTLCEPSVLLHEVAHFQIASPERRRLPDFGMGAGPESGVPAIAEAARQVYGKAFETEEQMTSLLGILWEAAFGQPAILAFQEQNWLEGVGRASTAEFFKKILGLLRHADLIGDDAEPLMALNCRPDPACAASSSSRAA